MPGSFAQEGDGVLLPVKDKNAPDGGQLGPIRPLKGLSGLLGRDAATSVDLALRSPWLGPLDVRCLAFPEGLAGIEDVHAVQDRVAGFVKR